MQNYIGFIDISDALTEAMLGHPLEHQKIKNERHAAWERSGAKRNERHAAWECFSCFYGPVGCLKEGPEKVPQTVIFNHFSTLFDPTHAEGAPRRRQAIWAACCILAVFAQPPKKEILFIGFIGFNTFFDFF